MILFVATDEELAALHPLGETGGAPLVPPIVDAESDYERFVEERAPARLRTMPHVVVSFDVSAVGFTRSARAAELLALSDEDAASLAEVEDDALARVAERWLSDAGAARGIATLRKLARVAVHRGGHVLGYALTG